VAVRDYQPMTPARKKRLREIKRGTIERNDLKRVIEHSKQATTEIESERRKLMDEVVAEFRSSKGYQQEVVEQLRPDLERTFAQMHDYKQFVQQVVQNMNVVLESRYPGLPLEEKLNRASQEEKAVYWAAILMDEKLDAALFLDSPDRIREPREQTTQKLHGLVLKYVRIYQSWADRKQIKITLHSNCWADIRGNSRALGIIPHTLIDNAIKYAPDGTSVVVRFHETTESVTLVFESLGPKITPNEEARIFDLFYRGEAARKMTTEGTGFGLASAQNIARAHDTELCVAQDQEQIKGAYLTRFSVTFRKA
jgi:signal transduction histidine kinase